MSHKIFVINLGGSSSKFAVYDNDQLVVETNMSHNEDEVKKGTTIKEQGVFRTKVAREWLEEIGIDPSEITAFAVRGGGLADFYDGGTYHLEGDLLDKCLARFHEDEVFIHGTQAVLRVALGLSGDRQVPIYLTDPATIDEQMDIARVSGHPDFYNRAVFHALNAKAVARHVANGMQRPYDQLKFVVAHMGAGTSVSAHKMGRVIDVNNCLFGDGPMSPNRAGKLQMGQLVEWCYSGKYTQSETEEIFRRQSGLKGHLGTDDVREVEAMVQNGNMHAKIILDAYILQIAQEIAAKAAALNFEIHGVILTGGVSNSSYVTNSLNKRIGKIAPLHIVKGELENEGLALGAYRVLTGVETPVVYNKESGDK